MKAEYHLFYSIHYQRQKEEKSQSLLRVRGGIFPLTNISSLLSLRKLDDNFELCSNKGRLYLFSCIPEPVQYFLRSGHPLDYPSLCLAAHLRTKLKTYTLS